MEELTLVSFMARLRESLIRDSLAVLLYGKNTKPSCVVYIERISRQEKSPWNYDVEGMAIVGDYAADWSVVYDDDSGEWSTVNFTFTA